MAQLDALIETRVKQAMTVLTRHAQVRAVYVFGSQIEGRAQPLSDVDIAVFIENLDEWDFGRLAHASLLVHREVGNDLELHFFSALELLNADPASFAAYILKHGIPISLHN